MTDTVIYLCAIAGLIVVGIIAIYRSIKARRAETQDSSLRRRDDD